MRPWVTFAQKGYPMTDVFSKAKRSEVMRRVKSQDTGPEIEVRRILHQMGYRFRVHNKNLPGKPDIVLPKYKTIVFVNGCFWHGHTCAKGRSRPTTNVDFWNDKVAKTIKRDGVAKKELQKLGWRVITIWECSLKSAEGVRTKLRGELQAQLEKLAET